MRTVSRNLIYLALLALWDASSRLGWLPEYIVGPTVIAVEFVRMLFVEDLIQHIGSSLFRSFSGFFLGAGLGVILGLLAGFSRATDEVLSPLISVTYPVPKIAIFPILMVWFGIGDTSKVVVIAMASFYPTFINSFYGAKGTERVLVWSAQNMGASIHQLFYKVVLPAALPQIFAGMRVALALSFVLLFASEMINARHGLGALIMLAEQGLQFDIMYVAILSIAILGFASDRLLGLVRKRVLRWQPQVILK
ncbi:MAG: ABC transporter permease [Candidatus Binatia bacterium]